MEGILGELTAGVPGSLSFVEIELLRNLEGAGATSVLTVMRCGSLALIGGLMGGTASMTGVLGMWILTVGGVSSTGRMRRSASLRRHQRTS